MEIPGFALTLNSRTALTLEIRKFQESLETQSNTLKNTLFGELSTYQKNVLDSFLNGLEQEADFLEQKIKEKVEIDKSAFEKKKLDVSHLNRRQIKALQYLKEFDYINRREYANMFEVNFMTAYRDLMDLYKRKLVRIAGTGRSTRYYI